MDVAIGIYRLHAASHHINFWFPKFRIQRVKLAIGITDANVVEIDEGDLADAGAGERFDGPGTDATQADDTNVGMADSFQAFR